jgi:hypothetical protein
LWRRRTKLEIKVRRQVLGQWCCLVLDQARNWTPRNQVPWIINYNLHSSRLPWCVTNAGLCGC